MAKKKYYNGKDSAQSGDMLPMYSKDMSAMPQQVIMREYKKEDYIDRPEYPDTYNEKNAQENKMVAKAKSQLFRGI